MDARRSVLIEIAAIGIATIVFIAAFRGRPAYVDFVLAAIAVALIVASIPRTRRFSDASPITGDPKTHNRSAWLFVGTFTAVALVALAALGTLYAFHEDASATARFENWHWLLAMVLYFPWALLQQSIFQYYLFGRLLRVVPLAVAIAITAIVFSFVHFPRWPVMIVVLIAGSVWTFAYFRFRRLLPLAVSHAILGASLHYWVFGDDLLSAWLGLLSVRLGL